MTTLEVKIKNLVEGLDNVKKLADELQGVGNAAKNAGQSASAGKQGFTELSDGAEQYRAIGIRSFAEIRAEIARATQAHQQLTSSGKLSGSELQTVTSATREKLSSLNAELKGTVTQNTEAASTGGMLGGALSKMTPQTAALSAGFDLVKDNVGKLIGAFTALAIAYGLKESVEYAARTETLGITMGVVAKNAGYGAQEISKYEKEVKGLGITTQGTREAITQMIQAGLEIGPKAEGQVSQVAKLARAAQDLAVVTGESSSATLTRLITNISQLDTVGLRYMGLTVNVEAAEKAFAISVGKSAEQLTQKQKIQAVANEALVQAEKLQGAYEASMESVGKKVQSLKRYQEELANSIGDKLLPSYSALVDSVTQFLKDSERTVSSIDRTGAASRYLGEGVKEAADGLGSLFSSILNLGKEIYPTINGTVKTFLDLVGMLLQAVAVVISLGVHTEKTGKQITLLGFTINVIFLAIGGTFAAIKDGITVITAMIYGLVGGVLTVVGQIIFGFGKIVAFFKKDMGKAIQDAGNQIEETGQRMKGFAGDTVDQFGRGENAVAKFGKSIKDSQKKIEEFKGVTNFDQAEMEVLKLVEAVRKAGMNTKELSDRGDALTIKLKEMHDAGSLTGQQFDELSKRIKRLAMDDAKVLMTAVDEVGMKLTQLDGEDRLAPLNKEFGSAVTLVVELGNSTKATAALMNDAFA